MVCQLSLINTSEPCFNNTVNSSEFTSLIQHANTLTGEGNTFVGVVIVVMIWLAAFANFQRSDPNESMIKSLIVSSLIATFTGMLFNVIDIVGSMMVLLPSVVFLGSLILDYSQKGGQG